MTEVRGSVRSLLDRRADRAGTTSTTASRSPCGCTATGPRPTCAEGHFWLSRLLLAPPTRPWAPYATYAAGYLSYWAGDTDAAVPELEAAAESLRGIDDSYRARALIFLGGLARRPRPW